MNAENTKHELDCSCCASVPTNPSVHQSIEEVDFERSIWQAAIDNDVDKINKFARSLNFDPNTMDKYGYTALHYAARNGSMDAAKRLINLGADCNAQTGSLLATSLHRAVSGRKLEMVKFLLQAGADTKITDADGQTPLDRAIKENHEAILNILKQFPGKPDIPIVS